MGTYRNPYASQQPRIGADGKFAFPYIPPARVAPTPAPAVTRPAGNTVWAGGSPNFDERSGTYRPAQTATAATATQSPYQKIASRYADLLVSGKVPGGELPEGWSRQPGRGMVYTQVMPRPGFEYIYDPTGGRHEVPVMGGYR